MIHFDYPENWPENWPEDWQDLMLGYALGNLDSEEAEALHQLLATHPELVDELSTYEEFLALLPYNLPLQTPANDLETAIVQAIYKQTSSLEKSASFTTSDTDASTSSISSPSRTHVPRQINWHNILLGLGTTIAIGTMLLLSLDNDRLRQQVAKNADLEQELQASRAQLQQLKQQQKKLQPLLATLQQPNTIIYSLQSIGQTKAASASLVAVPGHRQMVLVSENMPTLPKDKVYRLWASHDGTSGLMYCGQFSDTSTGTAEWEAPDTTCSQNPKQIVITVDEATASTSFGGFAVMQSRRV
jgi:uncharacterized membrane-anchored protein YhcB (DUF1043 family)